MKDWTQNIGALKLLVGAMTGLLVLGMILLVVGMVRTAGEMRPLAEAKAIAIPAGHTLVETTLDGERLLLRLETPEGQARLLILRLPEGDLLGDFHLTEAP